ncbi:MAG TPA: hypothetical protein DCQ29_01980 [Chitinophagaceae bacterium]|nr:hypothetical protein [Chitinophagaceae bacterium]
MNRLIIIGNGFDLAHGYETRYDQFIVAYFNEVIGKLKNQSDYEDEFLSIKNVNNLNRLIELNSNGQLLSLFSSEDYKYFGIDSKDPFFLLLVRKSYTKWVDIEIEYFDALSKIVSQNGKIIIDSVADEIIQLNQSLTNIKKYFIDYLSQLKELNQHEPIREMEELFKWPLIVNDLRPSTDLFGFGIHSIEENNDYIEREEIDNICILNFNYTNTTSSYLKGGFIEIFIHGNINDYSSVIMGYSNINSIVYNSIIDKENLELSQHFKYEQYSNNYYLFQLRQFLNSGRFQVFSIGHSLGKSDQDILSEIVNHEKICGFNIFHYDKNGDNLKDYKTKRMSLMKYFKDQDIANQIIIPFDRKKNIPQKEFLETKGQ